ncbi:MAG TPA: hypothetical protein VKA84_03040 [Gemmatimonadaceae bacterium]|nr:hypothetical protein [Gemmatimonadaceae bacterium]
MPVTSFDSLPDDARVWVFAADRPITGAAAERLLGEVDAFLARWQAHGSPLTCARAWRDDRFLAIGVDQSTAGASGCSIDGMFRILQGLERQLGASLVGGGRVSFRDDGGEIRSTTRGEFEELAAAGRVSADTPVFDATVTTRRDWQDRFEVRAGDAWHASLLG